jgi:hypothetical protein
MGYTDIAHIVMSLAIWQFAVAGQKMVANNV